MRLLKAIGIGLSSAAVIIGACLLIIMVARATVEAGGPVAGLFVGAFLVIALAVAVAFYAVPLDMDGSD